MVKIISREGTERQQGDYSSWNSPSSRNSPSSSSTSSRTSIQGAGLPSWYINPSAVPEEVRGSLQPLRTVQQDTGSSRGSVLRAATEGYKAGRGQEYSLEGLQKLNTNYDQLKTKGIYEKSNSIAGKIDSVQNSILNKIPDSALGLFGKPVLTGVTNLPELAVQTAGAVPLGLESMARNRGAAKDSIMFGLGATVGGLEQKARDNPGELAGELIGSYGLAKGYSKLETNLKPGLSKAGLKNFASNERGSLGTGQQMIYREKLDQTHIPLVKLKVQQIEEQKFSMVSGMRHKQQRTVGAYQSAISQRKQTGELTYIQKLMRNSLEEKQISKSINLPEEPQISKILQDTTLKHDNIYSLKPKQSPILKTKQDIIQLPKQITESILTPSIKTLPILNTGLNIKNPPKTKTNNITSQILNPTFDNPQIYKESNILDLKPVLSIDNPQIFKTEPITDTPNDILEDTLPKEKPYHNNPTPKPKGQGTFEPFQFYPIRKTKPVIALTPDIDLSGILEPPAKKRKTKHKMSKNNYGDINKLFKL